MSDKKQDARLNLLSELQSIKELLVECDSELNPPNQTTDPTISAHSPTEEEQMTSSKSPLHQSPGVLPGQQSLFELTNHCSNQSEPEPPTQTKEPNSQATPSKYENPFRTNHIKTDGVAQRSSTIGSKADTSDSNQQQPNLQVTEDEIQQQLNRLVAKYLPQIEAELRVQLRQLLEDKLELAALTQSN